MYSKPLFHDKSDSIYHAKEENMLKYVGDHAVTQMGSLNKYETEEEKKMFEDADKEDAAYRKRAMKRGGPLEVGVGDGGEVVVYSW